MREEVKRTNSVFAYNLDSCRTRSSVTCGPQGRGPIPISSLPRHQRSASKRLSLNGRLPRPLGPLWPCCICRTGPDGPSADRKSATRNREIFQVGSCFCFSREREGSPESCVACSGVIGLLYANQNLFCERMRSRDTVGEEPWSAQKSQAHECAGVERPGDCRSSMARDPRSRRQ